VPSCSLLLLFVMSDCIRVLLQEAELVDAFQQAMARERFQLEADAAAVGQGDVLSLHVDAQLDARVRQQPLVLGGGNHDREQAVFQRVVAEDVRDLAAQNRVDAVVQQRPRRVLARGTAAEVAPRHHDGAALRFRPVQREGGVVAAVGQIAPVVEAQLAQARARGGGEEARRDDAVGVDVLVRQHGGARVGAGARGDVHRSALRCEGVARATPHPSPLPKGEREKNVSAHAATSTRYSRGSAMTPATAEAAAVAGLASTVRAPLPWRPSKLRLEVETTSWPGCARSPFIAMHIEQPGTRHSAPAARNTSCRPSASASRRTASEPGTTSMRTPSATRWPRSTPAASRRSDRRELVQLPTNTTSTLEPCMGWPARLCM